MREKSNEQLRTCARENEKERWSNKKRGTSEPKWKRKKKLPACVAAICLGACVRVCREKTTSFRSHTFLSVAEQKRIISLCLFPFIPSLSRTQRTVSHFAFALRYVYQYKSIRSYSILSNTRKAKAPQPRNTLIPIARSLAYSFVSSCTLFTIFPSICIAIESSCNSWLPLFSCLLILFFFACLLTSSRLLLLLLLLLRLLLFPILLLLFCLIAFLLLLLFYFTSVL